MVISFLNLIFTYFLITNNSGKFRENFVDKFSLYYISLKESFDAFVHYRIDQSTKKYANVGESLQESLLLLREDLHI